jgi:LacI family transcriptional regulator
LKADKKGAFAGSHLDACPERCLVLDGIFVPALLHGAHSERATNRRRQSRRGVRRRQRLDKSRIAFPHEGKSIPAQVTAGPPAFLDADTVLTDNTAGVRRGVKHLVDQGHRRIGYLGDMRTIATAAERHRGYIDELADQGIHIDERLVRLDLRGIEKAEAAVMELLSVSPAPTALFTGQNLITIGAFRALRRLGLHQRVALIGFDDILLADLLEPGITVIAQDPVAIGRTAAEVLFRRLDGDRSASEHQIVLTRMITRGSGEIAP